MPTSMLRPIIVGGDIGAYGSARAFHEAYGVRTVVLAGVQTGPVAHSTIIDLRVVPGLDEDDDLLAATIRSVAEEDPGASHLVLGSADHTVHALVRVRDRLEPDVVVPYADAATMEQVTTKAGFSRLCEELGVPHPRTRVVRVGAGTDAVTGLAFPVVVKASSTAQMHGVEYEGKRKVAYVADGKALTDLLDRMAAAGFDGEVVVQEEIPGGDEDMAAVNAFCGPRGGVRFELFGQVLLEEATPNGLGNSVAQLTGPPSEGGRAEELAAAEAVEHARLLLEHVGWNGFANLDLKRDPRDGRYRFLELNPRVGRSGYAVTAAGYNVARMYGDAYAEGDRPPSGTDQTQVGTNQHLFTVVPLALLRRYVAARTWDRVRALRRRGAVTNVYYYRAERNPRRWLYVVVAMINQFRKFRRWHTR